MRLPSVNYGSTCRYKRKDVTLPLRHYCPLLTEEYNIPIAMLCDAEALPTYGNFPTLDPFRSGELVLSQFCILWHSHSNPNLSNRSAVLEFFASSARPIQLRCTELSFPLQSPRLRHCVNPPLSGRCHSVVLPTY